MKSPQSLSLSRNKLIALAAVVLILIIGYIFVQSRASGFFASVTPATASLTGNAKLVTEADGSKTVQFNAPPITTPPPTTPPPSGGATTTCPLPKYPDETCTGVPAGTALTIHNGFMEIKTPNTIIEGKDIRGCVHVRAPGVIIRKSKITCSDGWVIANLNDYSGTGLLVEDTEISCNNAKGTGIGDYNFTARRVNVHSCENGFDMDTDITLEDSYIHDLISYDPATDPHIDGIQSPIGSRLTIRHNTIYATNSAGSIGNASININNSSGGPTTTDTIISENLLAGGGYTLYCPKPNTVNFQITNNRFSTKFHPKVGLYGPATDCTSNETKSGNVYHELGAAVTLY